MIKIENVETCGWKSAIRGMRNPMNSWEKSDSGSCDNMNCHDCSLLERTCSKFKLNDFIVGKNDLDLMKKLAAAGTDHRKFMRMISVTMDVVAPLYWWKEFDTYKVGTVRNSCSTMHTIHKREFKLDDFSCEHLAKGTVTRVFYDGLNDIIDLLNEARLCYLDTGEKEFWWQIIQLLPSSYNQRSTVQLNYEVLLNIYHSRKGHKLDEWRTFCEWIEELPYMNEFI